ncbi:MAG: tetratricopeptide repeat protein [Bacteroidota bacterium]
MARSLNYFPKLSLLLLLALCACQQKGSLPLYQKEIPAADHEQLAQRMMKGAFNYYQGSAAQQFILEEAQEYDPLNATIHREIGVPYLKRGFAVEFEEYYKKATELDPVDWQGWRGYLYLFFYRDYERALADFNATDTLTPDFVDYPQSMSVDFMRGIIFLQTNRLDQALFYLDKYIQHEMDGPGFDYIDPKGFYYQGITLYRMKKVEQAKTAFERAMSLDKRNANLRYWLAKIALQEGDTSTATALLTEAKTQWQLGYHYTRPYVEDFFQIYWPDLLALEAEVERLK